MGKPAARLGDPTAHGNPLAPGPGATTVLIENKPAWRALVDTHICPIPIAPPAPAPHAMEICMLGSFSVLIEGSMAARQGDSLTGAGPPNPITGGATQTLIGDIAFGLLDAARMAAFCAEFCNIVKNWAKMTPDERLEALQNAINHQLAASGVPPLGLNSASGLSDQTFGQLDFQNWNIDVNSKLLNSNTLSSTTAADLGNTIYHEARHGEQWFAIAQYQAGTTPGITAAQLTTATGIPQNITQQAINSPLSGTSPQAIFGQTMQRSVYGAGGNYRNTVLTELSQNPPPLNTYKQYLNLPEEADAWNTGGSMTEQCSCD